MSKILISVPTYENIHPECFKSIYNLIEPLECTLDFDFTRGYDCARARNEISKKAKSYEYVLMVDSDIILPENALISMHLNLLKAKEQDNYRMILGAYPRKTNPNKVEIFDYNDSLDKGDQDFKPESRFSTNYIMKSDSNGYSDCKGGGLGCALIDTKVFSELPYPWFKYVVYNDGNFLSEDLYFCYQLKIHDYRIAVDRSFLCKHISKTII